MWIVACNIFVADRASFRGFLSVTWDSPVNTTVGDGARTAAYHQIKFFLEHHFVRNSLVLQPFEEVEHFLRNVLTKQLRRILIFPLVIVRLLLCVKVSSGQLGVGHVEGFCRIQPLFTTQRELTGQVALTKIVQSVGCINIMAAVELDLSLLVLSQRAVDVKRNSGFTNVHSEVRFDCFQGQPHLAIVHQIVLVEENPAVTERGVLPSLVTTNDDKIVDCLDFLRRKARENRFQNELVIVLIVEPCQQGFLGHKLFDRFIVIPNLGVFPRDLVFEDKKPIVGKHLAVENEWFKVQRYHLLILHPIVAP